MTDLTGRQIARNRETQQQPSFASHREHVMRLIQQAAMALGHQRPNNELPTITIIGAGNCQDIDLATLTTSFSEIRLIDIDAGAVEAAVSQHGSHVTSRIRVFAPIDIAAPLMTPAAFETQDTPSHPDFLTALESASLQDEIPISDVVVSTCLLSQIIDSASQIVPPDSPGFLPVIQAVRRGHLVRLLSLTSAAGRALLVTDLVSSDTVPQLASVSIAEFPQLIFQCLESGNFFSGLNPAVVLHDLQHIPACARLSSMSRISQPWLWQLGPRSFAVYAVEMNRSG